MWAFAKDGPDQSPGREMYRGKSDSLSFGERVERVGPGLDKASAAFRQSKFYRDNYAVIEEVANYSIELNAESKHMEAGE